MQRRALCSTMATATRKGSDADEDTLEAPTAKPSAAECTSSPTSARPAASCLPCTARAHAERLLPLGPFPSQKAEDGASISHPGTETDSVEGSGVGALQCPTLAVLAWRASDLRGEALEAQKDKGGARFERQGK